MKKKLLSVLLCTAMVASLVVGCGASEEKTTEQEANSATEDMSEETVEINYRTFRVDDVDVMETLIAKFEDENSGIKVNYSAESDEVTYYQKLNADVLSGSDVDVFDVHMDLNYYSFLNNGYLADLSDLSFNENYDASAASMTSADGKNFGYLVCTSAIPVMYNKAVFAENGWNVPETYEELVSLVNSSKEAGFGGISYCGATVAGEWMAKIAMVENLGTDAYRIFLEGVDNGSVTSINEKSAEAYGYLAKINEDGLLYDGSESLGYDQSIALFAQGLSSMLIMGSWDLANLETTYADIEVGIFALPITNGTAPTYCEPNQVTAVLATSEKIDAAKKFVDFLATPENVIIYQEFAQTIPTIAGGNVDSVAGNMVTDLMADHPMAILPVINDANSDIWNPIINNMTADLLFGSGDTTTNFEQVSNLLTEANLAAE